jgi:hypothetical protein
MIPAGGGTQTSLPTVGVAQPFGIAVDAKGDVFVDDGSNNRVVELPWTGSSYGPQTTVGTGLLYPWGVAVDAAGDVFIGDTGNSRVVEVPWTGSSFGAQIVLASALKVPHSVAVGPAGNVFVANGSAEGIVEIPAGGGAPFAVLANGLQLPSGVAVDGKGDLIVADSLNNRVIELQTSSVDFGSQAVGSSSASQSLTFAVVSGTTVGSIAVATVGVTGADSAAAPSSTCGAGVYPEDTICELNVTFKPLAPGLRRSAVVFYDSKGNVLSTVPIHGIGTGPQTAFEGAAPIAVAGGAATASDNAVAVDAAGDVFVAVNTPGGNVVEFPRSGSGFGAAVTVASNIDFPYGMTLDGAGNLFVSTFSSAGSVLEIPRTKTGYGSPITLASNLEYPLAVAVDAAGNVFFTTYEGGSVEEVPYTSLGYGSPFTISSSLPNPSSISLDEAGELFVTSAADGSDDPTSGSIVELPRGAIGFGSPVSIANQLGSPFGIAVDAAGNILFATSGSTDNTGTILEIRHSFGGYESPLQLAGGLSFPQGLAVDSSGNIYATDNDSGQVMELIRGVGPALRFGPTAGGSYDTSNQVATVENIGNATLDISAFAFPADFPESPAGYLSDCAPPQTLTAGEFCTLTVRFQPVTVSGASTSIPLSENVSVTTNTLNTAATAQSIPVAGTETKLAQTIDFTTIPSQSAGSKVNLAASATSGEQVNFASLSLTVCTASGTQASLISHGFCDVKATQAGDAVYAAASTSQTFGVGHASQTITFATIASQTAATKLNLTATASSGLTVTFSSGTPTVCTVSGATASPISYGFCTIVAAQAGNSEFFAAPSVSREFGVGHASQTIDFTAIGTGHVAATTVNLTATASSGPAVSFASLSPTVCTVSGATAKLISFGTCTIEATQAGNTEYFAASSVSQSFGVGHASQTINFAAIGTGHVAATTVSLTATASSGLAVSFASLSPMVCTVSGTTASLISYGTCTIQATQAGNSEYFAAPSVSRSFGVGHASQTIAFPAIASQTKGTQLHLSATATSGLAVSFASTTSAVCTVSGTTASLVATGTCTIQATQAGSNEYFAAPAVSRSFTVTP